MFKAKKTAGKIAGNAQEEKNKEIKRKKSLLDEIEEEIDIILNKQNDTEKPKG